VPGYEPGGRRFESSRTRHFALPLPSPYFHFAIFSLSPKSTFLFIIFAIAIGQRVVILEKRFFQKWHSAPLLIAKPSKPSMYQDVSSRD
ncbi:hypothetical protein, partial [Salinivibrio sp. EAGSL]|uniref:hypothetical protein n=1 Tax=Salinivibrio sp. EAGSL TaxID=2738468 RepID=UPI001C37B9A6